MNKITVKSFSELKDGEPVVFLGVHALRWKFDQWGDPAVAIDITEDERAKQVLSVLYRCRDHLVMDIDRNGKGISCTDTPETLAEVKEIIERLEGE